MERRYKPTSGCGDCGAWFTPGTTRRFGGARSREWASLGMLRYEDTVFARINLLARMWRSCPTLEAHSFHPLLAFRISGMVGYPEKLQKTIIILMFVMIRYG
ncbi:hypothetical protein Desor_3645 [Desulfosporosinus orientis DSM 765]|uniref:Uncharacterized protein n=1 Tax=Desulfosporosinus orientis (strain ATCC 19365 / DSM 765 / NCIMB 8382 / VKM B-1628 / Singapore I) TaxID=768706 RepID=G7WIP9_DESOD|nr:hypothetical protein [Desulfosporosinus orientis]AET69123.1 hypothetical protein Desor_3645 [Desulfosporosinus orientis DSM 765]